MRAKGDTTMNLRKVMLPLACGAAILLSSCGKVVSYDEFHKAASEVKAAPYTSCVAKVDYKKNDTQIKGEAKFKVVLQVGDVKKWGSEENSESAVIATLFINTTAAGVQDYGEDAKYYLVGSSFRVEATEKDDKTSAKFDKYGYCTEYKSNNGVIKFNWSK